MTNAFVIETQDSAAGVALCDGAGLQFFASDRLFASLDGRRFRNLREIQAAVDAHLASQPERRRPSRASAPAGAAE
jgi:hypothetical protein